MMLNKQMSICDSQMDVLYEVSAFRGVLFGFYADIRIVFNTETQRHRAVYAFFVCLNRRVEDLRREHRGQSSIA
jgi:hypothetical protein